MEIRIRVGRRLAIYIPKKVAEKLDIKEGDSLILRVAENEIVLKKIMDPIELALSGEKFAKVSPEEIERVSLNEQRKKIKDTS